MYIFILFSFFFSISAYWQSNIFAMKDSKIHRCEPQDLNDFLALAEYSHPLLQIGKLKVKSAQYRSDRSKSFDDPQMQTSFSLDKQDISLTQMVPWFGKRDLKSEIRKGEIAFEQNLFEDIRQMVHLDVKKRYYQLYRTDRNLTILNEHFQLLQHLEKVVQTQYISDPMAHSEVIKIQIELGKIENEIDIIKALQKSNQVQLQELLSCHDGFVFPEHYHLDNVKPFESFDQIKQLLTQNNRDLKNFDIEHSLQTQELQLMKKEYFPDFMLGVAYERNAMSYDSQVTHSIMGMLGMNIPIWQSSYESKINETIIKQKQTQYMKQLRQIELLNMAKDFFTEYENSSKKLELYQNVLIPKLVHALQSVQSAFQVNHSSFMEMIDTQRQLIEFKKELAMALVEKENAHAELIRIINIK